MVRAPRGGFVKVVRISRRKFDQSRNRSGTRGRASIRKTLSPTGGRDSTTPLSRAGTRDVIEQGFAANSESRRAGPHRPPPDRLTSCIALDVSSSGADWCSGRVPVGGHR